MDEVDLGLAPFFIFRPKMVYEEFWHRLFASFIECKNLEIDLKKQINGYSNSKEYRKEGIFGYSVPLDHIRLDPGMVGIFKGGELQTKNRLAIAAQADCQINLDSLQIFRYWISRADKKDPRMGDIKKARKIVQGCDKNSLVAVKSTPRVKLLPISDLRKTVQSLKFSDIKLPYCVFERGGKAMEFGADDPVPVIKLPCTVFAQEAFLGFDRCGGGTMVNESFTYGNSSVVENLIARIEYVSMEPNNRGTQGRLVANFMGIVIR